MMLDGYQTDAYLQRLTQADENKHETINASKMTGWICPVCGRGMSPYVKRCHTKHGKEVEFVKHIRGRWVLMSDIDGDYYCCSQCGEELPRYSLNTPTWDDPYTYLRSIDKSNFCPNCGADMRMEADERFTTQNIGTEEISVEDARRIVAEWRQTQDED